MLSRRSTFKAVALLPLWWVLIAGCTPPAVGPDKLDNYLTRLGRGLDETRPAPPLIIPPRLVDAGVMAIEPGKSSIGVLDFLALSGCELQVNLGRRNSSLGRHASPSQRLLLDLEFLALAPDCVSFLRSEGKTELAQNVADIAQLRQQELPLRMFNAILAGPEFQQLWRLPPTLGDYPAQTSGDVLDALNGLATEAERWLSGQYPAKSQVLEQQLSQLRAGDGGALLLAAAEQARALEQGSVMLSNRHNRRPLCPGGHDTERSKVVETVAAKFFAGDLQPWLAQLNQRQHALMAPILRLEGLLTAVLPDSYRVWQAKRDALLETLQTAPKAHVGAIKTALNDCPSVRWNP